MVRIGVMGAGYWGSKHIRNFYEMPEAELVMVCDLSVERLQVIKNSYPTIGITTSSDELLGSGVDAVVIATPPMTHYGLARQALSSGKHVLVEKPVATNLGETTHLIGLAAERDLRLMAGHTYEYNAAVEFLRGYVASGELGELFYIDSARLNLGLFQSDVDVLWDLAPHDISMITYILGEEPEYVSARGTAHINPTRLEVAHLEMLFSRNVMAHVHVSWLDPCKIRRVTLVGSRKMVVFDDVSESDRIRIYDKGVTMIDKAEDFRHQPVSYRYGDVYVPHIPGREPLNVECSHFVECIQTGEPPRSGAASAMRVTRILERATASICSGGIRQAVNVPTQQPVAALVETNT